MNCFRALSFMLGLSSIACSDDSARPESPETGDAQAPGSPDSGVFPLDGGGPIAPDGEAPVTPTAFDLTDVKTNPGGYDWFDFRPNVKKLILAGAAETEHIAILWYTVTDGSVGLHYHSKTESVYVIDGTQTDGKGTYPTGTIYFNPPGSGHAISDSSGFFLLAYAAPPDFAGTDLIEEYTPVRMDTEAADLPTSYEFEQKATGVRVFTPDLHATGGMTAAFIETTSSEAYDFTGNYVLVLEGDCVVQGKSLGEDELVVAAAVAPRTYTVAAADGGTCLALGVSF